MITYTVNGTDIRSIAQRLETSEGTQTAPGTVGEDVVLPGADGALDAYPIGQQRRPDGVARITFAMSIKGVDPDTGLIVSPYGTLQEYLDNVDESLRMWRARRLDIIATRPDGSQRRGIGHLVPGESLDFTRAVSSPAFGRYVAAVDIPAGRWEDITPVTSGAVALSTGGTLDLSAFAAATAVCTDLDIRISPTTGTPANPRLTTTTGFVAWNAAIASGRELRIQTRIPGTVSAGPGGSAWTPGYDDLEFSPGPLFFEIDPCEDLTAELSFTGGGTMTVEVAGRRHYGTS